MNAVRIFEDDCGSFVIPDDAAAVMDRVEQRINNASPWLRFKRWLRLRGSRRLDEVECLFYIHDQRKAYRAAWEEGREFRAQTWAEWKRWLKDVGADD